MRGPDQISSDSSWWGRLGYFKSSPHAMADLPLLAAWLAWVHEPRGRRPTTGVRRGPPGRRRAYRAGRYWALTAGAFFRAATH